ncbi:MAG: DUF2953 domain-containing protein [Ruminococcaceae bacterium]|nr:DUF2953 domain-containing protein [Oscillospiraceae bacterium]
MTVVLIVLGVIILLITAILLTNVSIVAGYGDKFYFKLKIFIFNINLEKLADKFGGDGEEPSVKLPEELKDGKKKKLTPSDIIDLISFVGSLIRAVLGEFFTYARLKICNIRIAVGSEDAAKTALLYGTLSSALYTAIEFLDSLMTVKKNYKHIGIEPDFTLDSCRVKFKIVLKIKIIHLLLAFIHLVPILASGKGRKII